MEGVDLDEDRDDSQDKAVSELEAALGEHQGAKAEGLEEQPAQAE